MEFKMLSTILELIFVITYKKKLSLKNTCEKTPSN